MTSWAEIITDYAMLHIDDVRLTEKLEVSPALFFREMSLYVQNALPMLNRPPELLRHLQGEMRTPRYDDFEWTSDSESTGHETVVDTGKKGYELMSCVIRKEEGKGNISFTPYPEATYDPETGFVTFPSQDNSNISYVMDFYSDGAFTELTMSIKRLLGLAVAVTWDSRFERNWLSMTPKIKDSSFDTVNESNYIDKNSKRKLDNKAEFEDELHKYEQDVSYNNIMNRMTRKTTFI